MKENYHPFLCDDEPIKWHTLLPKYIEADVDLAIELSQKNINQLSALPFDSLTFENTILALEKADDPLSTTWGYVEHLDSTCDSEELRSEKNKMLPKVAEFGANILLNDDLWLRIKAFAETEEAEKLQDIDKKLLIDVLDSFRDSGADLCLSKRERLKEIKIKISQLSQKFGENIIDSRNAWEKYVHNKKELKGLPKLVMDVLRDDAKTRKHRGYRISLNPGSVSKVMQYLESDKLREEIFRGSMTVGRDEPYNNSEIVENILSLRNEIADILGHKTYADLVLKHRMAKNGPTALSFIENLHERTAKFFMRDIDELENFRAKTFASKKTRLKPWETAFLSKKLLQTKFDFDGKELWSYFELKSVITGLFEIANRLYGIRLIEQPTFFSTDENASAESNEIPVWHKDVKYFKAFEENGEYLGGLYLDIHPRDSKNAGGWMSTTKDGYFDGNGTWHHPIATICTNLTPATTTSPSLLSHGEVETLFHEFGHTLHHLFGKVKHKSMNGTSVAWDFVELPSQIMENFCWERESLDVFARHFKSGKPLSSALFNKMIAARNHLSGMGMMRQLSLSKLDMELHQNYSNYENTNIESKLAEALESYRIKFSEPVPTITLNFGHVFDGGYSAGYYSYKWAEVLDADAFSKFKNDGAISWAAGEEFRNKILSKGDSEDADVLYRDFMGRDPDIEPLLIRSGLAD